MKGAGRGDSGEISKDDHKLIYRTTNKDISGYKYESRAQRANLGLRLHLEVVGVSLQPWKKMTSPGTEYRRLEGPD